MSRGSFIQISLSVGRDAIHDGGSYNAPFTIKLRRAGGRRLPSECKSRVGAEQKVRSKAMCTQPNRPKEILHVFGAWTLILDAEDAKGMKLGDGLDLLDGEGTKIGEAVISKLLHSRNPQLQPIELTRESDPNDFKEVKFVRIQEL
jgi:hypothetical protein